MAWFEDIEAEVIRREQFADYSTTISTFEEKVLTLEKEALTYKRSNGFQPAIKKGVIYHFYYTEGGGRVIVPEHMNYPIVTGKPLDRL